MTQKSHDEKNGLVFERDNAITIDYQGEEDLTVRPCPIPPRPLFASPDTRAAIMIEFEGGEEDSTIRPIAPDVLEKIRQFRPQV
jgi:hypothetical protein